MLRRPPDRHHHRLRPLAQDHALVVPRHQRQPAHPLGVLYRQPEPYPGPERVAENVDLPLAQRVEDDGQRFGAGDVSVGSRDFVDVFLRGLDGEKKMGKSLDNYIAVAEAPKDQFGKTMRIPDARWTLAFVDRWRMLHGWRWSERDSKHHFPGRRQWARILWTAPDNGNDPVACSVAVEVAGLLASSVRLVRRWFRCAVGSWDGGNDSLQYGGRARCASIELCSILPSNGAGIAAHGSPSTRRLPSVRAITTARLGNVRLRHSTVMFLLWKTDRCKLTYASTSSKPFNGRM